MAKKKTEPKVIETIRNKNISLATKRRAMKEARLIAKGKLAEFIDDPDIDCFAYWSKTPSGHDFWENIDGAKDKTA